jgi:hypothetical protein
MAASYEQIAIAYITDAAEVLSDAKPGDLDLRHAVAYCRFYTGKPHKGREWLRGGVKKGDTRGTVLTQEGAEYTPLYSPNQEIIRQCVLLLIQRLFLDPDAPLRQSRRTATRRDWCKSHKIKYDLLIDAWALAESELGLPEVDYTL